MPREKILIVDDSPTELKLAAGPLQAKGYTVVTAGGGEAGLAKAASERPAVIVLDVVMPDRNGFQVCRQLKTDPETAGIKVLMLTSKSGASDKFWAEKQGADAYLTKPFRPDDLVSRVAELLGR